ncbi:hypothetical protein TrLO_g5257 [Triparma laevis f. longispina]|uniref:Uncharacterized protein n=1 Tax=Triparma laevis f. longispina TaxID=1714387 RepID=A0A9W7E3N8_9STRA|nr:hypothetical protein TrLO_g5257 [Triparma laevis f. longispina]
MATLSPAPEKIVLASRSAEKGAKGPHGTCELFQDKILGHMELLDALLKADKLSKGARIILSGSELSRSAWLFTGFQPFVEMKEGHVEQPGGLYMSALAKEHPDYYFATVSPGATPTKFYDQLHQPLKCLANNCMCVFLALRGFHTMTRAASALRGRRERPELPPEVPQWRSRGVPVLLLPLLPGRVWAADESNKYAPLVPERSARSMSAATSSA